MNNDIRKLIDDNWDEIKELIVKKIEAEQKPKTIWDLKTKDSKEYYRIKASGCIEYGCFNATYDEYIREVGNAFLTREEAEFTRERRKIGAIMRKYSRPFEGSKPFENGKPNYVLVYNHSSKTTIVDCYRFKDYGSPCFESKEIAQKVIDEIGKERLEKYWFGVEE